MARGHEREDDDICKGQDFLRLPGNPLREAANRIAKVQSKCFMLVGLAHSLYAFLGADSLFWAVTPCSGVDQWFLTFVKPRLGKFFFL
jgi:hypothetical protein